MERRSLRFQYQLTRAEIEEALLCLDYKKEGNFRDINVGVISLIGVGDRIYTQYTAILLDRVIGWCGSVAFVYHLCACV